MLKAVFVDRDGTIARDVHYCSHPKDFELMEGAAEAIRLLNQHDFKVIIVTNQSGIARGYFDEVMLMTIHRKMKEELARKDAFIDAIYFCPHHPEDNCSCRKPQPGMILRALADYDIDLKSSFVVGDLQMDIDLGRAVGCKTILVTQEGQKVDITEAKSDYVAPTIYDAAVLLVTQNKVL